MSKEKTSRCGWVGINNPEYTRYHDEEWEHGADYPPVFMQWTTRRNLEECLRFMDTGHLKVSPLITHRVALDDAPEACEELIRNPNAALGVVFLP